MSSKKNYPTFIVLTLCILFSASMSAQQTYYINADNGNDNNEGISPQKAWKTLDKVNSHLFNPGDKLCFKRGTVYYGQFKPQGSGKKNAPVIVQSYGKGKRPVIHGKGILPATVYLHNLQYYVISELEITNTSTQRQAYQYGVLVELKDFGTARDIVLKDLYVHDVNGSLIKQQGGAAGIQFNNGGKRIHSCFDGLVIEQCHIKDCARNGIMGGSDYWSRASWYPNKRVIIRNNLIEGVPGDGIVPIGCDSCLIERNVMRNCPRMLPDSEAAAGIWPWICDNTLIQYNEVSDHKAPWDAQGFDSDYNCRNTIIQYNYSHDNEGGFLLICNNGDSPMPYNIGNRGTIVRYNISINDGIRPHKARGRILSPIIHVAGPTSNTLIHDNIFYIHKKEQPQIDRTIINFDTWGGYSDSTTLCHNIFYTEEFSQFIYGQSTRNRFEENLYYGTISNLPNDRKGVYKDPLFKGYPQKKIPGFKHLKKLKLQKQSPFKQYEWKIPYAL